MTISDPTMSISSGPVSTGAAPGAQGPGASVSVPTQAVIVVGSAAAALVALGIAFRSGKSLPPLRVDAINVLNVYFSWLVVDATVKVLCYRYHGHPLAQAYLLIA